MSTWGYGHFGAAMLLDHIAIKLYGHFLASQSREIEHIVLNHYDAEYDPSQSGQLRKLDWSVSSRIFSPPRFVTATRGGGDRGTYRIGKS